MRATCEPSMECSSFTIRYRHPERRRREKMKRRMPEEVSLRPSIDSKDSPANTQLLHVKTRSLCPCCIHFPLKNINPFTAMMSFRKRPVKVRTLKPLSPFVFFFALASERIFIKTHSIESRLLQDRSICCLLAHLCIFHPGNFTSWGSEGVNTTSFGGLTQVHQTLV